MQVTKKQRTLNPNVPSTPSALAGLASMAAQVVSATPVKAKPAKVVDVSTVLYTISAKGYKPVTDKHSATEGNGTRSRTSNWNAIKDALAEKACTYSELVAKVTEAATAGKYLPFAEPASFVRKHIARGHLVAQQG